jgi:hypothetical protein
MLSKQTAPMMRAMFIFFWFLLSGALTSLFGADSGLRKRDLREREINLFEASHSETAALAAGHLYW